MERYKSLFREDRKMDQMIANKFVAYIIRKKGRKSIPELMSLQPDMQYELLDDLLNDFIKDQGHTFRGATYEDVRDYINSDRQGIIELAFKIL